MTTNTSKARAAVTRRYACVLALVAAGVAAVSVIPAPALAAGPDAIMTPSGYSATTVSAGDDTSNLVVNLPFAMNWNGTNYSQIYINMNGNCTFGAQFTGYNPSTTLAATNRNIMAPFWADVDTRNAASGKVTYSSTTPGSIPQVDGHDAFFVNWIGVGRYNQQASPLNSFQLVLVDRSDTGAGNFDFIFNYDQITWDIATAASTVRARAGWGFAGSGYELPGSGKASSAASALLDSSPGETSLIANTLNADGQLGRYVFEVRSGQAPNVPPQLTVTDRTLEGNAPGVYVGYDGTGDAVATDPDGSITSLVHDRPDPLPLGTTEVTWIATDNRGMSVSVVQEITVRDTTAPANPIPASASPIDVWTEQNTVTVDAEGATDGCSGVAGMSYEWSRNAPAVPDTTLDPSTEVPGTPAGTVAVYTQPFAAGWPTDLSRSSTSLVRTTTRATGDYAAQVYTTTNTRRTASFERAFDLTAYSGATLAYSYAYTGLDQGTGDYGLVEFSADDGTTWTELSRLEVARAWTTQAPLTLPAGRIVHIRFTGSINRTNENCMWDDIVVQGTTPATQSTFRMTDTEALEDGSWYFNLRTLDNAGNWSAPVALGPFRIDRVAPVTASDAPTGWSAGPVTITLTPSDAGLVTATRYSLDGVTWTDYAGPITIAAEGTTALRFYSIDAAGHTEAERSAVVRIDGTAPAAVPSAAASALSTQSVEFSWAASTDDGSGIAGYRVYRDGVPLTTTDGLAFADSGLTPGQTYEYSVVAIDHAGNESPVRSVSCTPPASALWLTIGQTEVDMGELDPDAGTTVISATSLEVGGVGEIAYDLSCSADNFVAADPETPALPAQLLAFITRGFKNAPEVSFSTTPALINSSSGSRFVWSHEYVFDYSLSVPWDCEPGEYQSKVVYTAVQK